MIDLNSACLQMSNVLAAVNDDQLALTSPCTECTVGDLVDHVDQVARLFAALACRDTEGMEGIVSRPDAEHLRAGWRNIVTEHVRSLGEAWDDPAAWHGTGSMPGSELSNEMWGKIALTEVVVHGWDICTATSQPFDLPESTLRDCLDHVTAFVPNAPVPGLGGPPVDVDPDATLIERIVAITGRRP